jgi:hypothetical protein
MWDVVNCKKPIHINSVLMWILNQVWLGIVLRCRKAIKNIYVDSGVRLKEWYIWE